MSVLGFEMRVWSSDELLDRGIGNLVVLAGNAGWSIYAATGAGGGLTGYNLSVSGELRLADTQYFGDPVPVGGFLVMVDDALVVGGSGATGLIAFNLEDSGGIGGGRQIGSLDVQAGRILSLAQTDGGVLYIGDSVSGGVSIYRPDAAGGFVHQGSQAMEAAAGAARVVALETTVLGGQSYLLAVDERTQSVVSFRVDPVQGDLVQVGSMGAAKGLGVMQPVDLDLARVGGETLVLLASAAAGGGAISVMRLAHDGQLLPTDHVLDTRETRFGRVQSLEVVEADGRSYVLAGGGDDGLSLFVLAPGGRLVHLQSLADSPGLGLAGVSSIAALDAGGRLEVLVASQSVAGLTRMAMPLSGHGAVRAAGDAGGDLLGTAGSDILSGGAGGDRILAGAGDDILIGGLGGDTLDGGAGRDILVLQPGGESTRILGFDPGQDRLDFSSYTMFYDAAQLDVVVTVWGALVRFRNETIEIYRSGGGGIGQDEIAAALHVTPHRPPLGVSRETMGGAGHDILDGYWGPDHMEGRAGNDRIAGRAGDDRLLGGDGDDRIVGEAGDDSVTGGAGRDTLFGGEGDDTLLGDDGRDVAFLGAGNDRFHDNDQIGLNGCDRAYGEAGDDWLEGGGGNDTFFGGPGRDTLLGGRDDDWLAGGDLGDVLEGGAGADRLAGEGGDDTLFGGDGADTLFAGPGQDRVSGGQGADRVWLGAGNDLFLDHEQAGTNGQDTVFAGPGADTLEGRGGDDVFHGGDDEDVITGGEGNDLIFGGRHADVLHGNQGNDTVFGGDGRDLVFLGDGDDVFQDNGQGGDLGRDTVFAGAGNDTVQGGNGGDVFYGGDGEDVLLARLGNDQVFGGLGADTLSGGAGADTLTGGEGADHFVFADHHGGPDLVTDFVTGQDQLVFNIPGMQIGGLQLSDSAAGALVDYGSGRILLEGVDAADLEPGDFLFL